MPRVVHFEIHASEPEKLAAFYTDLFGWKMTKWDASVEYWIVQTGQPGEPGIDGGLVKRRTPPPGDAQGIAAYICTVDVPSLDDRLARSLELGAAVALPKMPVPGVGWLAYIKDPDGNVLGMMQRDETAR